MLPESLARLTGASSLLAFVSVFLLVSTPVFSAPAESSPDRWFATHVFDGDEGCLAIREGQRLEPGDSIVIFRAAKAAFGTRIAYVVAGDSARKIFDDRDFQGVYSDSALWRRIGCYWALGVRGVPAARGIAHYEPDDSEDSDLPLAIQGLPPSALTIGARSGPLTERELGLLEPGSAGTVPERFLERGVLRAGQRYDSVGGDEFIEVFLGRAVRNPAGRGPQIRSIEICHLFLHNGRVLASEISSRMSGEEEHVDVDPPQLDERNWYQLAEQTVGFLSRDGGTTWDRLSIDVGFEGVNWAIAHLTERMPRAWEFYLYTIH
jgi:hypothetical protein